MKRFVPQRGMNDERMNARNACKNYYIVWCIYDLALEHRK